MKLFLALSTIIALGVLGSSCGRDAEPAEPATELPLAALSGQLDRTYQDIAQLATASSGIAVIEVSSAKTVEYERIPFWVVTATVADVVSGELVAGRAITIVETGGIVPGAPGKGDVEVAFEGVRLLKTNERWLVFLQGPDHVGPIPSGAYAVTGSFQGKLRIGHGESLEFPGPDALREGPHFAALREFVGRPLRDAQAAGRAAR